MTAQQPGAYGSNVYGRAGRSGAHPPAFQRGLPNVHAENLRRHPARPAVNYLTVAEVAAELRVSKMTVYRLIHLRELAATRIGRSFRVTERALDKYLAGSES